MENIWRYIPAKFGLNEVSSAIEEMLACDGPVILDVMIDREANVLPMVPAGAAIDRMISGMA